MVGMLASAPQVHYTDGAQVNAMQPQTIGGAASVVLVVWYVFWRVGFVRELARRSGIGHHRQTKPFDHRGDDATF